MSDPPTGLASTMRVLRPHPVVLGFYDGRIAGRRLISPDENWFDDGAYELGICSYAVVDGAEALVYDTHISLDHARFIRRTLEDEGVTRFTVVLSHWHADHVAGTAAFADCEIIAHRLTLEQLVAHRAELEQGMPPIAPLLLPTRTYGDRLMLRIGGLSVELRHADIHSLDGTMLWLPDDRLLLAGDTLEDPITYVVEPERLRTHLADLAEMRSWPISRILPNHGDPDVIAAGGNGRELIPATIRYVEMLARLAEGGTMPEAELCRCIADDLAARVLRTIPAYDRVHRRNLKVVAGAFALGPQ